jgi:hypothetical protein
MPPTERAVRLALLQALFYLATGAWSILHIRSFEAVTGPKVDRWLVRTVGALVGTTGLALALAGRRRRLAPEVVLVAGGNAAALAAIDVVYVARRRIRPIYLLDAAVEVVLVATWAGLWRRGETGGGAGSAE